MRMGRGRMGRRNKVGGLYAIWRVGFRWKEELYNTAWIWALGANLSFGIGLIWGG